jgi:hypothetical protein
MDYVYTCYTSGWLINHKLFGLEVISYLFFLMCSRLEPLPYCIRKCTFCSQNACRLELRETHVFHRSGKTKAFCDNQNVPIVNAFVTDALTELKNVF